MSVLYLAGPMTGHEDFNRPAFLAAAGRLRRAGFTVLNPAETPAPVPDPDWGDWMRAGIRQLLDADGVALLPGAGGSRGAALECKIAHELAVPVRTVPRWLTLVGQTEYMGRLLAGWEGGD
jgi:hypothetical protein